MEMDRLTNAAIAFFLLCLMFMTSPLHAKAGCPNAKLLSGKLITDICWSCMFPLKIAGINMGGGNAPSGASNRIVCNCPDNNNVPHPGLMMSMWEPARIVELVRQPGCMSALNGISMPVSKRMQGVGANQSHDEDGLAFYNYHYYAFPLLTMMNLFSKQSCYTDGFVDFDLMFMSELDPTWNNDTLAFYSHPEAAAVSNPLAIAACSIDAIKATTGSNTDSMWWCAGAWGGLYPFTGHTAKKHGMPQATSLLGTRLIAALHRRGMARRTIGNDASCKAKIDVMLPKRQYKFTMFFPRPEANDDHIIGESVMKWGNGRTIPATGEDAVYILWRWHDCCVTQ